MGKGKALFGLLLSVLLIYLTLWKPSFGGLLRGEYGLGDALFANARINFSHLLQILSDVKMAPLVICFLMAPVHVFVRAHRWSMMIQPLGVLHIWNSFSLQMVGYLANSVLPLRMGEVIRGALLARRMGIPTGSGLATVVLERVLDMVSMLILVAIVAFLFPFPREIARGATALGIIAAVGLAIALYLGLNRDHFGGVIGRWAGDGKLGTLIKQKGFEFAEGFALFRQTRHHFVILVETIVLWLIYAFQGYLVLMAFDFPDTYTAIGTEPILASFVVLIIGSIGISVPSAPAAVGTFHAVVIFGLSLFGVPTDAAAGFALMIHAVSVLFFIIAGIPFMWREGLHLGELKRIKSVAKKSSPTIAASPAEE